MGKVVVTALIENLEDLYNVKRGQLQADQARRIEVHDAVVDTGATTLLLPKRMIATLGLEPLRLATHAASAANSCSPFMARCG